MIFTVIKYWQPIAAAVLTAWLGFGLHTLSMHFAEKAKQEALDAQKALLIGRCEKDKALTREIDNDHLKQISYLDRRVAEYRRLHKTHCVPVADSAGGNNGSTRTGHVGAHAVDSAELAEYAETAERYRIRLVSCQQFIRRERNPSGPNQ